ncbi:MAG: amidohydrolase family protein, partial [Armatimonadetes bacterium]|nr:amidohydrolase family protein [Armatimonadota bacterium]
DALINGDGLAATPGFIDIHGHSDLVLLADPRGLSKLAQGVTTEACGQCGMSPFPVPEGDRAEFEALLAYSWADVEITWKDPAGYMQRLEETPLGVNLCPFLGANVLVSVTGATPEDPSPAMAGAQLAGARDLWGVSMGVGYEPLHGWPTEALAQLAKLARGKTLAVHLRNEGAGLLDSIREMLAIVGPEVHLEIAHLKASGDSNWGKVPQALALIEAARASGANVGFNVYPYTAGSTFLASTLPDWLTRDGQAKAVEMLRDPVVRERLKREHVRRPVFPRLPAERVLIASAAADELNWAEGKTLAEVAKAMASDPHDAAVQIVLKSRGRATAVFFTMSEDDVRAALRHPLGSVCSDGLAFSPDGPGRIGYPHPRSYGSFARFLGRYVREEGLLSLAEAVRKCTSLPASRLGLRDRGILRPGSAADVVLLDPARIADTATYDNPHSLAVGVEFVLVNGVLSIAEGRFTGQLGGRVLRFSLDGPGRPAVGGRAQKDSGRPQ